MERTYSDLIYEAELYLQGYSLRRLSKKFNVSHITIYDDLTNKLEKVNMLLYQEVAAALKDNAPKSVKDESVKNRVITTYQMFVNEGKLISEIANKLNVSFFTTYRDLDKRLVELFNLDPYLVSKEMVNAVKKLMLAHREENLLNGNDAYLTENRDSAGRFSR